MSINKFNNKNIKIKEILRGFQPPFHDESFTEFYMKCGFTRIDVCELLEKSEKTIRRWEKTGAPRAAYLLIYAASGFLLSDAFNGFRLQDNLLFTGTRITYNYGFTASELIEYSFFRDYSNSLAIKNEELSNKIYDLENYINNINVLRNKRS